MIEAERLSKTFEDGTIAVRDSTFRVAAGEVVGLLGPNGAGKTTTVHMLLGHLPPTSGRALLGGVDVAEDPLQAKRNVAYVSENVLLYGALTAEQNMRFFARISGVDIPPETQDAALDRVGLGHATKRRVQDFSKGMRQRLGIAIALAKDPPAIVMDEPSSGLDPVGARDLSDLIVALRAAGKAVLVVTHDVFRIRETADRLILIRDGRSVELERRGADMDLESIYRRTMAETEPKEVQTHHT